MHCFCAGLNFSAGLAAGFTIGIVGDAGVRDVAQQPLLVFSMMLILIFAEVLGIYGLIVALIMKTATGDAVSFPGRRDSHNLCCSEPDIFARPLFLAREMTRGFDTEFYRDRASSFSTVQPAAFRPACRTVVSVIAVCDRS